MKIPEYIVYMLHHPLSVHVYIGQTSRGLARFKEHDRHMSGPFPVCKWIKRLRERGLKYQILILEEGCTKEQLCDAEVFYIAYFKSISMSLLNLSDGGENTEITPLIKHKMSDARRNYYRRLKQEGKSLKNGPTAKSKEFISVWQAATCARAVASYFNVSTNSCTRRAAKLRARGTSLKYLRAIQKGRKVTAKTVINMSIAQLKRYENPEERVRARKNAYLAWNTPAAKEKTLKGIRKRRQKKFPRLRINLIKATLDMCGEG